MVHAVRKGNRAQNKARKKLEDEGWLVYVARRGFKGQQIDIFGLWDIIAYKDGSILFVQVKSNYCPPNIIRRLGAFLSDGIIVRKEVWVYKDYSRSNPWVTVVVNSEYDQGVANEQI